MRRLCSMIPALLIAASPTLHAQGCGPTRLKVTESVTLDMPPSKVWASIGNFHDMSWDADTTGTSGDGGNQADRAVRVVTLRSGATMQESLYKYDGEAMSYSYHVDRVDVTRLPVQNASGTLEVVPIDGGAKSAVRWKFAFYRNLAPGEGTPDAADGRAVEAMKRFLQTGLDGLKTRAEPRT